MNTVDYILGGHGYVEGTGGKVARVCLVCSTIGILAGKRTSFRCQCGKYICNPTVRDRMCWLTHMLQSCSIEQFGKAIEKVKQEDFNPIEEAARRLKSNTRDAGGN